MADPAADQDAQQIQEADAGQHSEPPELPARHCTLCALQSKPAAVADDQFVGLCTSLGDCRPCHGHLSCIYMFHSNVLTPKWSSHRFKLLDETCELFSWYMSMAALCPLVGKQILFIVLFIVLTRLLLSVGVPMQVCHADTANLLTEQVCGYAGIPSVGVHVR